MASKKKTAKTVKYPIVLNVCMAMGAKRKNEVIRAFNVEDGEDFSKVPVYPTLRNAFKAGVDLIKYAEDGKWLKFDKSKTAAMFPDVALAGAEIAEEQEFEAETAAVEAEASELLIVDEEETDEQLVLEEDADA